jgi:hypothetical protein
VNHETRLAVIGFLLPRFFKQSIGASSLYNFVAENVTKFSLTPLFTFRLIIELEAIPPPYGRTFHQQQRQPSPPLSKRHTAPVASLIESPARSPALSVRGHGANRAMPLLVTTISAAPRGFLP